MPVNKEKCKKKLACPQVFFKELLVKFYTNMLEKGMKKEEALRQAKLAMIKEGKYASPYFWSAFVMYGE